MKRILIMLFLPVLLLSCSKDKDSEPEVNNIVGEWIDSDGKEFPKLTIQSDRHYVLILDKDTPAGFTGTYGYDGTKLILGNAKGNFVYQVSFKGNNNLYLLGGLEGATPKDYKYKRK